MNKNIGIYMIKNKINNKFYIGSSKNLKTRYKIHLNNIKKNKHPNNILTDAFLKYGKDNFEYIIIESILIDDYNYLIEREQWWLEFYKPFGNKGYNIATIAGGVMPYHHYKAVVCYDLNGSFVKEFDSILKASIELNIKKSSITSNLNNQNKKATNYIFKYKTENYPISIPKYEEYNPKSNVIKQNYKGLKNSDFINENRVYLIYSIRGDFISTIKDLKLYAINNNVNLNSIRNCMRENEVGKLYEEYRTYKDLIFISQDITLKIPLKIKTNKQILIQENVINSDKKEFIKATQCADSLNISKNYLNLIIKTKKVYKDCIFYYEYY